MLFIFGALDSVHWPHVFVTFIRDLNIALLVGVEAWLGRLFLPLSCTAGELSAYTWLALTLALPLACSLIIFVLSAAARAVHSRRRDGGEGAKEEGEVALGGGGEGGGGGGGAQSLVAAIYTLHIWLVLLTYPSLCRAVFPTFVCQEVGGVYYLSEDTREHLSLIHI